MKAAMPTLKYKPILCNFTDTEDGKDFTSHDMEIDADGNINYIERQVGCFTADEPYLEYDEEKLNNEVLVERIMLGVNAENSETKEIIQTISTILVYMVSIFIFSKIANEIAQELGIPLGNCDVRHFADGEILVQLGESVRGKNVYIVQSTCSPVSSNLMELLI